ncbi:MAG: class II glutamine amidotransferase [Limisphaerales bacterium]
MIAVVSQKPVACGRFLDELAKQSCGGIESPHGDGFGAAIFTNGHWFHVREQCPVWDAARSALNSIEGTILLLHSRKASDPTSINLTKLHPFCWPGKGQGIMFCQNGTIRKHDRLKSSLGPDAIDTEKYFDIVIRNYKQKNDLADAVVEAANEIYAADADTTSLNSCISDGRELVCYKGRILPQNVGYHTLYVHEEPGLAVVSTEMFEGSKPKDWKPLEGVFRKSYVA